MWLVMFFFSTRVFNVTLSFAWLGLPTGTTLKVNDILFQQDLGVSTDSFTARNLLPHQSQFLLLSHP
jgi:hypothetical protein